MRRRRKKLQTYESKLASSGDLPVEIFIVQGLRAKGTMLCKLTFFNKDSHFCDRKNLSQTHVI